MTENHASIELVTVLGLVNRQLGDWRREQIAKHGPDNVSKGTECRIYGGSPVIEIWYEIDVPNKPAHTAWLELRPGADGWSVEACVLRDSSPVETLGVDPLFPLTRLRTLLPQLLDELIRRVITAASRDLE